MSACSRLRDCYSEVAINPVEVAMSRYEVTIFPRHASDPVNAVLDSGLYLNDLVRIEHEWSGDRETIREKLIKGNIPKDLWPESLCWDFVDKANKLRPYENEYSVAGIMCEQQWQGAMIFRNGDSVLGNTGQLIYVEYFEVAPWNWKDLEQIEWQQRFRRVGSILFL